MIRINFNRRIKVKLTETGKRIYREHYAKHGVCAQAPVDYDGFSEFPLWNFIGVFGEAIDKGRIVMEDGCIYMYEKDIENVQNKCLTFCKRNEM